MTEQEEIEYLRNVSHYGLYSEEEARLAELEDKVKE